MPTCSGCGVDYEDKFQFCPYCGKAKPQEPNQKTYNEVEQVNACPICKRNDKVEKVSVIYRNGSNDTSMSVPVADIETNSRGEVYSNITYKQATGSNETRMAQLMRPPVKPEPPSGPSKFLYIFIWFLLCMFPFAGVRNELESSRTNWLVLLLLLAALTLITLFTSRKFKKSTKNFEKLLEEYQSKTIPAWEYALNTWNSLYFCHRDGIVFVPGTKISVPVERMNEILRK